MARTAPAPNIPPTPGMNPGTFLAGGGGSGGGSGGKGGGAGAGKKGGKGKDGDNDAEGGGKGSGKCGQGGKGACTNCGHNVSRGDPVDVSSGKVLTVPKTDLFMPGFFNLDVRRSYSSERTELDVGLGFGWIHSLAWFIEERRRTLLVQCGDGRSEEIPRVDVVNEQRIFGDWYISRGEGFYVLMPGKEFIHLFSPVEPGSTQYKLDYIVYRDRGKIALEYDKGRLCRVIDTAGRVISFANTRDGRIESISVADPQGTALVFARYRHDERGDLVAATDADGNTTAYAYDEAHRLIRLQHPNGLVFHFVYDRLGRCIETWGDVPGQGDPALALKLPELLNDGQTRARGIYHCRFEFFDDGSSEVVDSVRLQRFFAEPDGKLGKAVGASGGVTTRTFDDLGRVKTQTDANGATWSYDYDVWGLVTRQSDPEGHAVQVARDAVGRELEIIDAAGGVTKIGRDSAGEIVWVRDQNASVQQFTRSARGLVEATVDRRAGLHSFEWDSHANCVARTYPNGARYAFSYDYWGRLLSITAPNGAVYRYTYTDGGEVASQTDPLGRTRRYQYDSMGNLARETQPDGTSMEWYYGGLDWLYCIRDTNGAEIQLRYNREGWPLYIENERGERQEYWYDSDGAVAKERDAHGRITQYGHDLLGRVVWYDRGAGRHELTHSPSGLLLEEIAPDGSRRAFGYNPRAELVRADTDEVALTWERDPVGNIVSETFCFQGASYRVDNQFVGEGDRRELKTSLGHELVVRRDANGRTQQLWSRNSRLLEVTRDPLGLPVERKFQGSGRVRDSFDAANRLRQRRAIRADASGLSENEPDWVGPNGETWFFDYTTVDELASTTSPDGEETLLEYDVRRQLTKRSAGDVAEEFRIDAAGNYYESGPDAPPRRYAPGNQLVSHGDLQLRYDAQGFLIEKARVSDGKDEELTRFEWNPWGFLKNVETSDGTSVEFLYDAFARRVAKRVNESAKTVDCRHYVWDRLSMVHDARVDCDGNPVAVRTYLFEENDEPVPIGHRDDDGDWVHYLNDVNGTPMQILDGAGRVVGGLQRAAFGRTTPAPGSMVSTWFRAPGQYEDVETGLHYNRYRYYDPDSGRYISPDPIGIDGGLNLYGYAPNPIGWSDPMGWYHVMEILSAPSNFTPSSQHGYVRPGNPRYRSGYTGTPCPDDLQSNSGCHTEQKFCADLLEQHRALKQKSGGEDPFRNQNFKLKGKLPPCPACHAAMMQAASETGANIEYQWENPKGTTHSVTYDGSSSSGHSASSPGVTVSGSGDGAELVSGYTHLANPLATNQGPPQPGSTAYGYGYAGSYNTYYEVSKPKP